MPSPENKFQPHEFYTPAHKTGSGSAEQVQLDEDAVEALKQIFNSPSLASDYEQRLSQTGELVNLEKAGIVPVVEKPDPLNQTQEAIEEFNQKLEKRNEILRYIAIGMLEGTLLSRR